MENYKYYIDHCHEFIWNNPEALSYFRSRFLTDKDLEDFKVGYTPANWQIPLSAKYSDSFYAHFPMNGYGLCDKILIPNYNYKGDFSGMLIRSYKGTKYYCVWYLNSRLSHWNLLGFYQAMPSIIRSKKVIIVESFFDLIAIRPWYLNVISTQTARVDRIHISFLKRYANHIVFAYNNDFGKSYNTGRIQSKKGIELCRQLGIRASLLELPDQINDFSDLRILSGNSIGSYLKNRLY